MYVCIIYTNNKKKVFNFYLRITNLLLERMINPLYWSEFIFLRSKIGHEYKQHLNTLHNFTEKVIRERMQEYETTKASNSSDSSNKRVAFLDMLLDAKSKHNLIDLDGIKEEVDTFMFAGHDTTATSLTWAIQLIGSHSHVQEKLHREVDELFGKVFFLLPLKACKFNFDDLFFLGDLDRSLTNDDLPKLKYLEAVIKESLRLYAPSPFIARKFREDTKIGDYKRQVLIKLLHKLK
jgi:cytochrome P450